VTQFTYGRFGLRAHKIVDGQLHHIPEPSRDQSVSRSVGSFGGVVVLGSNSSTSKQTMAAMKAAEIQRAELIDMIDLPAVGRWI
jgi:hypothetical protein